MLSISSSCFQLNATGISAAFLLFKLFFTFFTFFMSVLSNCICLYCDSLAVGIVS